MRVRGLLATSIVRTLGEICGRLAVVEAVVIADAALHNRRVKLAELVSWADAHSGRRGIQNMRRVLQHVDGESESPMETRLRMVLVMGGLPRPRAQAEIHDRWGRFIGRIDLFYAQHRLGIEYDGGTHRDTLAEDNRRQNRLLNAGVRLLRFTAGDVFGNPDGVVSQVKAATAGSGALATVFKGASAGARG